MRGRDGEVYALTYRIGRHLPGEHTMHCIAWHLALLSQTAYWATCICKTHHTRWIFKYRLLVHVTSSVFGAQAVAASSGMACCIIQDLMCQNACEKSLDTGLA